MIWYYITSIEFLIVFCSQGTCTFTVVVVVVVVVECKNDQFNTCKSNIMSKCMREWKVDNKECQHSYHGYGFHWPAGWLCVPPHAWGGCV